MEDSFGEAVVMHGTLEPCEFPSYCQFSEEASVGAHKEVDLELLTNFDVTNSQLLVYT